jgi:hypothetical protein
MNVKITNEFSNKPLKMFASDGSVWILVDWSVQYFGEEPTNLPYEDYVPEDESASEFLYNKYGPFILGKTTGVVWSLKRSK